MNEEELTKLINDKGFTIADPVAFFNGMTSSEGVTVESVINELSELEEKIENSNKVEAQNFFDFLTGVGRNLWKIDSVVKKDNYFTTALGGSDFLNQLESATKNIVSTANEYSYCLNEINEDETRLANIKIEIDSLKNGNTFEDNTLKTVELLNEFQKISRSLDNKKQHLADLKKQFFEDFENKIKKYNVKLFLLCSPHNPIGRVWKEYELNKIIEICSKYKVFIVSDEVHCDFAWNSQHICLLKYDNYKDNIILCTSPTKSFNLAGLQISNIFIPSEFIRKKFQRELWNNGYSLINIMGMVACESAYKNGESWLNEIKKYILENIRYTDRFLKERLPKIKLIYPEGTYLLWLDFNELNLSDDVLESLLLDKAKIWLDGGKKFGKTGSGFQRLNVALPRKKLKYALESLERTFKNF